MSKLPKIGQEINVAWGRFGVLKVKVQKVTGRGNVYVRRWNKSRGRWTSETRVYEDPRYGWSIEAPYYGVDGRFTDWHICRYIAYEKALEDYALAVADAPPDVRTKIEFKRKEPPHYRRWIDRGRPGEDAYLENKKR